MLDISIKETTSNRDADISQLLSRNWNLSLNITIHSQILARIQSTTLSVWNWKENF